MVKREDIRSYLKPVFRRAYRHRRLLAAVLALALVLESAWLVSPVFSSPSPPSTVQNETYRYQLNPLFRMETALYPVEGEAVESGKNISVGFATETYELDFGRIPANGSATKLIKLKSPTPAWVTFIPSGRVKDELRTPGSFILDGTRTVRIEYIPSGPGNVTGTLMVRSVVGRNPVGTALIQVFH
ncbi:MAG: hypothetical protein SVS85_02965 [Candidatus Nanohaloarchaea archaeon]|nr:hypothetical protein [Candidatus Nanohaloarchaea archaeon]